MPDIPTDFFQTVCANMVSLNRQASGGASDHQIGLSVPDSLALAQVHATLAVAQATDRQTAAIVDQTEATDRLVKATERNGETLEAVQKAVAEIDLNVQVDMEFPDQLLRAIDRLLLALR